MEERRVDGAPPGDCVSLAALHIQVLKLVGDVMR